MSPAKTACWEALVFVFSLNPLETYSRVLGLAMCFQWIVEQGRKSIGVLPQVSPLNFNDFAQRNAFACHRPVCVVAS